MSSDYQVEDREVLLGLYRRLLFVPALAMVPRGVPPNAITLFGVGCSTLSVAAALVAIGGQPLGYLASAAALMIYLTADNVDGPHARRTGRSSTLGEFLDHGLDGVASGAVLLTAALILRMDGVWFFLLALLGAVGFAMPFWEQFRTGVLVIPEMSSTEGITMVVFLDLLLFFAGEPPWLRFSMAQFNATTAVLLFALACYMIAIGVPIVRVARQGLKVTELLLPLVLALGTLIYMAAGASPLLPATMVSLIGADLVCRMIAVRHGFREASLMSRLDWLVLVPALVGFFAPELWTMDGWAAVGAALATLRYGRTLLVAGAHVRAIDHTRSTQGSTVDPTAVVGSEPPASAS